MPIEAEFNPPLMENSLQRIRKYALYIGVDNKQIDTDLGMSSGAFSKQLKNDKTIGVDKVEYFLSRHPDLNPTWLLTGNGEMLKKKSNKQQKEASVNDPQASYKNSSQPDKENIPLVEQYVVAGFGNSDFAIKDEDVKEYYVVPKFKNIKIDFMIEVRGSSMYPKYNSGDVIACRIIRESNFIQWNKCHVIATQEQGILVKRIKEGENNTCIQAISDNKDYNVFSIPKEEITGIALVVGVIRLE